MIDDDGLGFGVIVLDGVRIGKVLQLAPGTVVAGRRMAIAVGVPARVINMRSNLVCLQ